MKDLRGFPLLSLLPPLNRLVEEGHRAIGSNLSPLSSFPPRHSAITAADREMLVPRHKALPLPLFLHGRVRAVRRMQALPDAPSPFFFFFHRHADAGGRAARRRGQSMRTPSPDRRSRSMIWRPFSTFEARVFSPSFFFRSCSMPAGLPYTP